MKRRTVGIGVLAMLAIGLVGLVAGWLHTFNLTRKGSAATVADLQDQRLPPLLMDVPWPSGARDIWYLVPARSATVHVSFSLSEEEFLAWAERQRWPVHRITLKDALFGPLPYHEGKEGRIVVERGYGYSNYGSTRAKYVEVMFDSAQGRVFLSMGDLAEAY